MVHPFIWSLCILVVSIILVGYGEYWAAYLAIVCGIPLIAHKLFFQFKRPLLFVVLIVCTTLALERILHSSISRSNDIYYSGFAHSDATFLEESVLEGVISQFPGYRFSNNQYVVELANLPARVLVYTNPHEKFTYLERVSISGQMINVRDQGEEWYRYYQKLGVHYVIFRGTIKTTGPPVPEAISDSIKLQLFHIKAFLREEVSQRFSSYASAMVLGMLLGEKDELSKEEKEMFNYVGLSHILVVSGYNISLLISFIFMLLKVVPRYVRVVVALLLIALFTMLVGADGSVVRAATMGSIIIFAKIARRPSSALNVLFVAVISMLVVHPFSIFDAGLHLSFIATFSLLILPYIPRVPEFIATSIWVFCFVSVYIAHLSGFVSLAGIISNILVVLLLPVFMMVSLVSVAAIVLDITIWIDAFTLDVMSRYIFMIAHITKNIPRFETNTSPYMTVMLYGLVLSSIVYFKNRYSTKEFIEKRYQKPSRPQTNQSET